MHLNNVWIRLEWRKRKKKKSIQIGAQKGENPRLFLFKLKPRNFIVPQSATIIDASRLRISSIFEISFTIIKFV